MDDEKESSDGTKNELFGITVTRKAIRYIGPKDKPTYKVIGDQPLKPRKELSDEHRAAIAAGRKGIRYTHDKGEQE